MASKSVTWTGFIAEVSMLYIQSLRVSALGTLHLYTKAKHP